MKAFLCDSIRSFAENCVTQMQKPDTIYYMNGRIPPILVHNLMCLGYYFYQPVPDTDLYIITTEIIEGLARMPIPALPPLPVEDEDRKPYTPKKKAQFSRRADDDDEDDLDL